MRKIEEKIAYAVRMKKNCGCGNTTVECSNGNVWVRLHGNLIYKEFEGVKSFTLAGWNTVTTRSRLNALGVDVRQKNWEPVYDGKVISSYSWYNI